ncbi:hypothetical protein D3C87_1456310 [compost metagenome]
MFKQRGMPFPGHLRLLIELIEALAAPQTTVDLKIGRIAIKRDGICGIGLQFYRIGSCLLGHLDQA